MKKLLFCTLVVISIGLKAAAQEQAIVHEGEFGFSVGSSQYFGDLNPNPRARRHESGSPVKKATGNRSATTAALATVTQARLSELPAIYDLVARV